MGQMLRGLRQLGRWADEAGLGGWAVMLAGVAVIAAALLTPAVLEVETLRQRQASAACS